MAKKYAFFFRLRNPLAANLELMAGENFGDEGRRVAVGEEQADFLAFRETEGLVFNTYGSRTSEIEISGDALEFKRHAFNLEAQLTIGRFDSQIGEKGYEPVAGQGVVVLREDLLDAGGAIFAGRKVGAEQ